MQTVEMANKKPLTIRLDLQLFDLLDAVSQKPNSFYFDRGRTWLIEHAIRETYGDMAPQGRTEANSTRPPA